MSLENLLKTQQLQPHNPTREAVQRLLSCIRKWGGRFVTAVPMLAVTEGLSE